MMNVFLLDCCCLISTFGAIKCCSLWLEPSIFAGGGYSIATCYIASCEREAKLSIGASSRTLHV